MNDGVTSRLKGVKNDVRQAAMAAERDPQSVELLVVSKTWPAGKVREVVDAGQVSLGENKVQEGVEKVPALPDHLHWHLIGRLQRNKVRKALPLFRTFHGIDSLKLATYVSNIAIELGKKPDVYLQVNLAGEDSKAGFSPDILEEVFEELIALPGLHIIGLMCIPPVAHVPEDNRPWFRKLRELRDQLEHAHDQKLPGLSMGMSDDFQVAIEEGSTIVRVGSAIFGPRNYL